MECKQLIFTAHAITRMFERAIRQAEVQSVVASGELIETYPDDVPFPSCLMLGFTNGMPLHVVVAVDEATQRCYVVTVYIPDPELWSADFTTRRRQ